MANRDQMEVIADQLDEDAGTGEINVDDEVNSEMDNLFPDSDLEKIELDVLGEKVEFSQEDIMDAGKRSLQKDSAAEKKLEFAAQRDQELTERELVIKGREDELRAIEDSMVVSEPNQLGKDFAAAVFDNEDELAKIVTSLDQRISKVSEREQALSRQMSDSAKVEAQKPVSYYHGKYNEIANDPNKHAVFNAQLNMVMQEKPYLTEYEGIDQAASATEEVFTAIKNPKENLVTQPNTVSNRKPKKPEEKEESFDDVMADMRSGRSSAW